MSEEVSNAISASLKEAVDRMNLVLNDPETLKKLEIIAKEMTEVLKNGSKILVCGNGGSLAEAMHFAEECTGRFRKEREPMAVLALSDSTAMSCIGNDFSFEEIFSRQVRAFGREGDMLFALTTSGNSKNVILALEEAKSLGMKSIGFLGRDGGLAAQLCDESLIIPGTFPDRIQEVHLVAIHIITEAIEILMAQA